MTEFRRNCPVNEWEENKEDYRLIWIDTSINDSHDSIQTQLILLQLNPSTQFYTDCDQCIEAIQCSRNESFLVITSGSWARQVLSKLSSLESIKGVFIFCFDREQYQSLMNEEHLIIGVVTNQVELRDLISYTLHRLEQESIAVSLFQQTEKLSRDQTKQSASFLWQQMLIVVFQHMPQDERSKSDMLALCEQYYRQNESELKHIREFRQDYEKDKAIHWYTKECFLYKLLNRALRTEDIELIYLFRFFITDLCSALKQEHMKMKDQERFTTYRGQTIPIEELEKWKRNVGQVLSINSFFSTSRVKKISIDFLESKRVPSGFQRVLFEIDVDPSLSSGSYADVSAYARYPDEKEILFTLNSLFRILSIEFDAITQVWNVKLRATDESIQDIKEYSRWMEQQMSDRSPIIQFGWLLANELGQVDRAAKYFQMLLQSLPNDDPNLAGAYNGLARVYSERNELNLALENYQKAYEIRQARLPPDSPEIAGSLHNIANILREKGDFESAIGYFQQALNIEGKNDPDDHQQKATILQNMGNAYLGTGNFERALSCLSLGLQVFLYFLPAKHPNISACLGDIAHVHENRKDYTKALDYYRQQIEMDEVCLPSDHPHLSKDLKQIAVVYMKNDQHADALKFCREKLDHQEKMSDAHQPRIAQTLMTMAMVLAEKQPKLAVDYYQRARLIIEQLKIVDDRLHAKCLSALGDLYALYKKFTDALQYLDKALTIHRRCVSPEHVNIADVCKTIAMCYLKLNDRSEALRYFNESLGIYQKNYASDHERVKYVQEKIAALTSEQNTEKILESDITVDPTPPFVNEEAFKEEINDEQHIRVVIDIESPSNLEEQPKVIEKEPKRKRKIACPRCSIL